MPRYHFNISYHSDDRDPKKRYPYPQAREGAVVVADGDNHVKALLAARQTLMFVLDRDPSLTSENTEVVSHEDRRVSLKEYELGVVATGLTVFFDKNLTYEKMAEPEAQALQEAA